MAGRVSPTTAKRRSGSTVTVSDELPPLLVLPFPLVVPPLPLAPSPLVVPPLLDAAAPGPGAGPVQFPHDRPRTAPTRTQNGFNRIAASYHDAGRKLERPCYGPPVRR